MSDSNRAARDAIARENLRKAYTAAVWPNMSERVRNSAVFLVNGFLNAMTASEACFGLLANC